MNLVANVHCHFMNSSHVPDAYFKAPNFFGQLADTITKNDDFLDVHNFWFQNKTIDNYITRGQFKYSNVKPQDDIVFGNSNIPGYHLITPLMMNMVAACNTNPVTDINKYMFTNPFTNPTPDGTASGVSPFEVQVQEYSLLAALYPYRVFPFITFNPLVPGNLELCKNAVGNLGFVGIKMYPAHGYSPDPFDYWIGNNGAKAGINLNLLNSSKSDWNSFSSVGQSLIDFYNWADSLALPITIHCQYNSMQKVSGEDIDVLCKLNDPAHFRSVLTAFKRIRINFAHFGGDEYSLKCVNDNSIACICSQCAEFNFSSRTCNKLAGDNQKQFAFNCIQTIIDFAKDPQLGIDRIFADVAAHYFAIDDDIGHLFALGKDRTRYVSHILSILQKVNDLKVRPMFGTDSPVKNVSGISDKDYLNCYTGIIQPNSSKEFYWDNAIYFIFGPNRLIPNSYKTFITKATSNNIPSSSITHLAVISNDNGKSVKLA